MNKSKARLWRALGIFVALLAADSRAVGQTKIIDITVDDPRPLAAAIDKIEELSGIPINYEDMPVYYSADVKDVTDAVARTPLPAGRRIIVARGGQLSVPIVVDAATGKLNGAQAVNAALVALISAYNSSGLPGGFDLEFFNGVFFTKPVRYRDATGATRPMTPVLSTPVTLPQEPSQAYQIWQLVIAQVSSAAGVHVDAGWGAGMGDAGPDMGQVAFGPQNEPADHVIARLLAPRNSPASATPDANWDAGRSCRLFTDATSKFYALNVHVVANRWSVEPAKPYSPPPRSSDSRWYDGPGVSPQQPVTGH